MAGDVAVDAPAALAFGLRPLAALLLVLGLVALTLWGLRRGGLVRATVGPGRLDLVAARALDGRNRLLLVRCDGRLHLLAVGPTGVTVVESRDGTPAAADAGGAAP